MLVKNKNEHCNIGGFSIGTQYGYYKFMQVFRRNKVNIYYIIYYLVF